MVSGILCFLGILISVIYLLWLLGFIGYTRVADKDCNCNGDKKPTELITPIAKPIEDDSLAYQRFRQEHDEFREGILILGPENEIPAPGTIVNHPTEKPGWGYIMGYGNKAYLMPISPPKERTLPSDKK